MGGRPRRRIFSFFLHYLMAFDLTKIQVILQNATSKELRGHRNRVHSVAWNMDGSQLASGATDHTGRVFSLDSRQARDRIDY